jgi:multidrug transporter EmrE-like cation transporter
MADTGVEPVRRVSSLYLVIILIAFILSLSALYIAFENIINQSDLANSYSFLAIGFFGLALSGYMLLQTRAKPVRALLELPRVITTLECPKCDFKDIRDFQRGDFIFKENGPCQKCDETMKITAIYREAKKKKQE